MKKLLLPITKISFLFIAFVLPLGLSSTAYAASCYDQWIIDYDSATAEYAADIERCDRAFSTNLCMKEADAYYARELTAANDRYVACLN